MTDNFKKTYNSLLDKFQKEYGKDIFNKTLKYQKQYGFEIGTGEHAMWNNEADAFKHTFMQADLTRRFGAAAAKYFGDRHEHQGNQSMGQAKGEENIDRWNNRIGRDIAQEIKEEYMKNMSKTNLFQRHNVNWDDIIAKKIMERMKTGKLITNPNDKRKYSEHKGKSTGYAASASKKEQHKDNQNGKWVTINGNHVFIEDN